MSEKTWKKLSIQEIDELWNVKGHADLVMDEIIRADKEGAAFTLGVDKLKIGYRITINSNIVGIYLRPDTEEVKQQRDHALVDFDLGVFREMGVNDPLHIAICPHAKQAGEVEWVEIYIIFYVLPEEFTLFCQEAEQIFNEYFVRGTCFRMIPDIWFHDMALIQFIRERVQSHPAMQTWFDRDSSLSNSADSLGWSGMLSR